MNQFLINSYALNNRKIDLDFLNNKNLYKDNKKIFQNLIVEKPNNVDSILTKEDIDEIEKFVDETFDQNTFNNLNNQTTQSPINKNDTEFLNKEFINKDIKVKKSLKEEKTSTYKLKKGSRRIHKYSREDIKNSLPLPSKSIISSSQFKVPSRGYVNLKGPNITLDIKSADPIETLKLIGKLGNYGMVIIADNEAQKNESMKQTKVTATFNEVNISDAFNSILLSANLQAIVEKDIIFVGKKILNRSLKPKVSKTFRLNQVNAASVADYLNTLGSQISKVMLVSGSIEGAEVGDSYVNKKEIKDEALNSYGINGGPLNGLIGTADLRLQTITLIGSKDLIMSAEKYLRSLDVRHRQVALTIKIIDVNLSKTDIKDNIFELRTGDTRIISNSGLGLGTGNNDPGTQSISGNVQSIKAESVPGVSAFARGDFINWLEAKIINENAKVLASPTLILGENPNVLPSGAASVDDQLSAATIGRPFKNEGFIKVGETVITGFDKTVEDGVLTCTPTEGTAGITFGAKVDKVDDNGFVTFALSPAISAVTKQITIAGCGIQNTLSVRKLDTGSIRVKNGDTLVLTGVLQDSDNVTAAKVPILGDIPLLGSFFRKNSTLKKKSELIILVTPKILKDK